MTKTAGVVVLLMAWSTSGSAQSWSSEQQELIAQVMRCNDGWSESIKHKKFDLFQTMCPETANAVYWYTNAERPVKYEGATGFWRGSADANRSATWADLQPTEIQIDGDLGLIYYSVVWTVETQAGETRRAPTRRLTVFRRVGKRWLMAGGSIASATAPATPR
ncbi:MAG TPA: nuclear transport factor 2 family protein [Vicinamibacterales bacterium]|jgi:ketosteroid isomerase-like protein|nr:nuclear transport factor 2 family protein [Vicinamibacterales bacterium]